MALTYKWQYRQSPDVKVRSKANTSFTYISNNINNVKKDKTLYAVHSLCNEYDLMFDVTHEDCQVYIYSRLFNRMINSGRTLHRCYDCGTNARAMYLKLYEMYNGMRIFTPNDQLRLKNTYAQKSGIDGLKSLVAIYNAMRTFTGDILISINSFGFGGAGHIWVVEMKRIGNGSYRYRIFQSSLRSHMLLDYIEWMDYAANDQAGIDISEYYTLLFDLYNGNKFTPSLKEQFENLFAYSPGITDYESSFCYAYFTANE